MDEQIINVLNALCDKLGVAVDWTQQNVQPYLQELFEKYVRYEIATSAVWIVIWTLIVALMCVGIRKLIKFIDEQDETFLFEEDDFFGPLILILSLGLCVFGVIVICRQCLDIVTALTFPEKLILDYISGLVAN